MKRISLLVVIITICAGAAYGQRPAVMPNIPSWASHARWYYINVPLYRNGDKSNDPTDGTTLAMDWPDLGLEREFSYPPAKRDKQHEGGDLSGVIDRLPYLQKLGINTLLLSPILTRGGDGSSDLLPLRHVDPSVGIVSKSSDENNKTDKTKFAFSPSDKLLLSLINKAHELNMRIAIEVDCQDRASPTGDVESQVEELYRLMARWNDPNQDGNPKDGIDGLAFRNIHTLSTPVLFHWFIKMKQDNMKLLTIGPGKESLFDTQINYHMGNAITHFFRPDNTIYTAKLFIEDLATAKKRYGPRSLDNTIVPISASRHGRVRSFYQSIKYDDSLPTADDFRRLAIIFQFFYSGAPMIYYGDEVGMTESENRILTQAMWWQGSPPASQAGAGMQGEFFALHKLLNMMRNKYAPIVGGDLSIALDDSKNKVLAISRSKSTERIVLVLNYGTKKQLVKLASNHPKHKLAILSPQIKSAEANPFTRRKAKNIDASKIPQFRLSGEQQISAADGSLSFWVKPMSMRVLLDVDAKK